MAAARSTAAANGAHLVSCRCADHDAWVEVELGVGGLGVPGTGRPTVRARAHAQVDDPSLTSDRAP